MASAKRVEQDALGYAPQSDGVAQGIDGEEAVDLRGNPTGNDFSDV